MKALKHLLFFGLLFMTQFTKAMVTAAQVTSLSNSSAATSASTFYSLVSTDTSLSQSQFYGYYTPNFVQLASSAPLSALIQAYANDIADQNFNQAEIDLIKLSAAVLRNLGKIFTQTALTSATDPWGSGNKFLVITPGNGNSSQQMVQLLINEFINLYSQAGGTLAPLNPGQKTNSGINLLTEKTQAIDGINSILVNAKGALDSELNDTLVVNLNQIGSNAFSDDNLAGNSAEEQKYLGEVTLLSNTGTSSINSIAGQYTGQVTTINTTASGNLDLLVAQGDDAATAAIYKSDISAQANNAISTINGYRDADISQLATFVKNVNDIITTGAADNNNDGNNNNDNGNNDSGGSSIADEVKNIFLEKVLPELSAIGLGVYLKWRAAINFWAKSALCNKVPKLPFCPPTDPKDVAAQKDLADKGLPTDINELITAVGENDPSVNDLASLINKSGSIKNYISKALSDQLDITPEQLSTLAGNGTQIVNLMDNISTVVEQVQGSNPRADISDIISQIGAELTSTTPASFSNMSDLVSRVNTALGGESPTFNTGSGAAATNVAAEYGAAFEGLEGMTSVSSMVTQIAAKVGTGAGQISIDQLIKDVQSMRDALDDMAAEVKAGKATAEDMQTLQDAADAADQVIWNSQNLEE